MLKAYTYLYCTKLNSPVNKVKSFTIDTAFLIVLLTYAFRVQKIFWIYRCSLPLVQTTSYYESMTQETYISQRRSDYLIRVFYCA